ncbi:hypothetical protein RB286 [Rhodopirellula baltica SH 1]|uniref:Uncharacterized protein n=1 Tax=Rhodopirellula baltica (strain DSM 10527 / NCIMB 13988 / SH1) TaxID=243090 RepID=Q7UYZ9_RHOBA|nr:hypothetical protein RB286 [Rhodopirellula baltica SH 1]
MRHSPIASDPTVAFATSHFGMQRSDRGIFSQFSPRNRFPHEFGGESCRKLARKPPPRQTGEHAPNELVAENKHRNRLSPPNRCGPYKRFSRLFPTHHYDRPSTPP